MARPSTFAEACKVAATNETSLKGTLGLRNNQGPRDTSTPMDLGTFMASNNNNRPRNNNQNNKGKGKARVPNNQRSNADWKRNAICHFCNKKGHIKPDCFAYQRTNQAPSSSQNAKQGGCPAKLSLAEQVEQLSAKLAALESKPNSSKN